MKQKTIICLVVFILMMTASTMGQFYSEQATKENNSLLGMTTDQFVKDYNAAWYNPFSLVNPIVSNRIAAEGASKLNIKTYELAGNTKLAITSDSDNNRIQKIEVYCRFGNIFQQIEALIITGMTVKTVKADERSDIAQNIANSMSEIGFSQIWNLFSNKQSFTVVLNGLHYSGQVNADGSFTITINK